MPDVNRVMLRGVVSDPPETREFGRGRKKVSFSIKTLTLETEDGEERERPAWHKVDVWNERSGAVAERLGEGSPVYVEGDLRTRSWEGRDGETVYFTSVNAPVVRAVDSPDPQVNRIVVIGTIGADPRFRETDDFAVLGFRVAVGTGWTPRGSDKEHTEWISVSVFGDEARRLENQLGKGQRVFAEGRLRKRKWTDKEGRTQWSTEVQARTLAASGPRRDDDARGRDPGSGGSGSGDGGAGRSRQGMGARLGSLRSGDEGSSGVDTGADDEQDPVPF